MTSMTVLMWHDHSAHDSAHAHTHLLAPVQTIFPELKIRAVVRGSRILIITAAKRCIVDTHTILTIFVEACTHTALPLPGTLGLYSAFLALKAMVLRSNLQPRLTVDTIFLQRAVHNITCTHTHMYTHAHARTCTHTHVYTHARARTHTHTDTHTHTHTHTHTAVALHTQPQGTKVNCAVTFSSCQMWRHGPTHCSWGSMPELSAENTAGLGTENWCGVLGLLKYPGGGTEPTCGGVGAGRLDGGRCEGGGMSITSAVPGVGVCIWCRGTCAPNGLHL